MKQQEGQENPNWLTDDLYSKMRQIAKIAFNSFVQTKALQQINAGKVFGSWIYRARRLTAN